MDISIDSYLNYWNDEEKLIAFRINLGKADEKKLRAIIEGLYERSFLGCTFKDSFALQESGLFPEVGIHRRPKALLHDMEEYANNNLDITHVEIYEVQTNEKISK